MALHAHRESTCRLLAILPVVPSFIQSLAFKKREGRFWRRGVGVETGRIRREGEERV